MSDVDDDNMSCVSSNVELIQTQNDALAETAQQDQHRFEELVSDTTTVSGSFERALGQENKACTLLQCKIDVLKRQHAESEKSNEALRKQIYNQQMEMERISSSIFQQTQEINLKFPSEGLSYYSNTVTIIANMVDYIQQLKNTLKNDIDESNQYDGQLRLRKEAALLRINNIREMMVKNSDQKNELLRLTKSGENYRYDVMEEKTAILNAQYNEFCRLKNERDCINRERDELVKKFDTLALNRRQTKQTFTLVSKRCEEITIIFNNESSVIRNIGMSIEHDYRNMMVEVDTNMNRIVGCFRTYKNEFVHQKEQVDSLRSREMRLNSEISDIRLQKEFTQSVNTQLSIQTNMIIEQDLHAVKIRDMLRQQVDSFSSSAANIELENIVLEIEQLQIEHNSQTHTEQNEPNEIENITNLINEETICIQSEKSEIANLETEMAELMKTARKMNEDLEKAKYELMARQKESSIIKYLRDSIKNQIGQTKKKNVEEINKKLNESNERISKLDDLIARNKLSIETLNDDNEKSVEDYISIQRDLWTAVKENDAKNIHAKKLTEEIENERVACENARKLLEDLERNSFPRNKIPADWVKSFVAEKQEYERLEKEKLTLVKLRDKLTVEMDSKEFSQESQKSNVEPKQKQLSENVKTVLYNIFKERISNETIGNEA